MSDYKHKQISLGGNSIYCEPHGEWLDMSTAISHACFQESPTYALPESAIDFKLGVPHTGISDMMDPMQLLSEWYNWWAQSDVAPSKMPDSLHTRTTVAILTHNMNLTRQAEKEAR